MTRPASEGYGAVLRLPGVPRAFASASLGRLSYATLSLALLLTVEQATGSYAVAGAAVGACALGSAVMPVKSRLVDRRGLRRVLPLLAVLCAAALLLVAAGTVTGVEVAAAYVILSGVAGLAAPPLGPSMRALWADLTPDLEARRQAYSLDSASEEVLFTTGPLLVAALLAVGGRGGPVAALVLSATLNIIGAVGLATSPATSSAATHQPQQARPAPTSFLGPLRRRSFALLILVVLGVGVGGGPLEVAVLARTQDAGSPEAAGILLAALSAGSVVGGLLWGRRAHRRRPSTHLIGLVLIMSIGTAAVAATENLALLGLFLALTGVASTPALVVAYLAADDLIPAAGRTEATTWVSTANNVGVALGAAAAGALIEHSGPGSALLFGATTLALTAALLLLTGGLIQARRPAAASAS